MTPAATTTSTAATLKTATTAPATFTETTTSVTTVVTQMAVPSSPFLYATLIPSLIVIPLVLICICCYKTVIKEPPSAQRPEKPCPVQTTVIVSCCECQEDRISQMEGKLDVFYNFLQRCSLMPLIWYPTRDMGRCPNFALMNPQCAPMLCGPKICPQPRQECFPLNSCSSHWQHHQPIRTQSFSRFLPLSPPTANKLCRSPLSLPPP
ncbi:anthrax toxin receptor-like [Bubalus bubalis]|uniref:anthrax toxin receptor-like n=1 Tax=Bubalus bubalis TaxID=89462 RepID=UPI001D107F1B|nr:anthrax toxin receptor-like [Bubalus bubalis]